MRQFYSALMITSILSGCAAPTPSSTVTLEPSFTPTRPTIPTITASNIPSPTTTPTLTPTITPPITPTLEPQTLGRIFPEGFTSPGVWSNRNTGKGIVEMNFDIHFDICLPYDFAAEQDDILSPISGEIVNIYAPGGDASGGYGIDILPDTPILGIEDLVKSIGYEMKNVEYVKVGMAHINPLVELGQINKGQLLGKATHLAPIGIRPNKVALVIIVNIKGDDYHFSPCNLPNSSTFCGKCCPDTPYNCP